MDSLFFLIATSSTSLTHSHTFHTLYLSLFLLLLSIVYLTNLSALQTVVANLWVNNQESYLLGTIEVLSNMT